ncbi:hypothetical protein DY000_02064325 [Brassica cretica]|uniref:MADS-box domain-containing protein n=1 Tax=Brassica cretica TaxID=69181 RepID=A0ABQ7B4A2_BRACR|nr:hypothetical protein DY000_02064325 [Brassica cretica]
MGFTFLSCRKSEKERKVSEYYKKQEKLLEGFNGMVTINETGFVSGAPSEVSLCSSRILRRARGLQYTSQTQRTLCFL